MIVESIRLENIKSYGAGPEGNGVTVAFQPGVNRIAGANGCGKTTIVEALGYALFSASPVFEENFKVETYLLAHGARAGEIDVTFRVDLDETGVSPALAGAPASPALSRAGVSPAWASYRLERGVGTSKRRSKVVDLADGSICAEGDKEVDAFLCSVLKLPSPERLTELFSKLVGVKQGRLVWPFDSKPKNAKEFFEPLLEVEVFRQCFDRLKPVVDSFVRERAVRQTQNAVLAERIRERADAAEKLDAAQQEAREQAARLETAAGALKKAQEERARQERLERELTEAAAARERADAAMRFAAESRSEAERRAGESEEAVERVKASEPAHRAYRAADAALQALEDRRKTRDRLRRERESASRDLLGLTGRRDAAREQKDLLLQQEEAKRAACAAAAANLAALTEELGATAADFECEQRAVEAAGEKAASVAAWLKALPAFAGRMKRLASRVAEADAELSGWDAAAVATASEAQRVSGAALNEARAAAARTEERVATLRAQLEQIAGGVCPFLGESCPQFDAAKVQADISRLEAVLVADRLAVETAQLAHGEAESLCARLVAEQNRLKVTRGRLERDLADYAGYLDEVVPVSTSEALDALAVWVPVSQVVPALMSGHAAGLSAADVADAQRRVGRFVDDVTRWWAGVHERIDEGTRKAALAKTERTRKETDAQNLAANVKSFESESRALGDDAAARGLEAQRLDAALQARSNDIALLDDSLMPFGELDAETDAQLRAREANQAGYEAYLQAKPLADALETLRAHVHALKGEEVQLAAALASCEDRLVRARGAFAPANLVAAKADCEARSGEVAAAAARLQHAETERGLQEQRFAEWQAAVSESAAVATEIARHTAAIDLTELARKTLRDAAPAVAQHLCARIAIRAQAVYNQINPDPLELAWDAERYSLRITPGERRFAMLSGGEQTKLALSMTLAMVEEFSRLRFCIFDEPTYGVDADSRLKLADAILQVQDAAGLDQLLLVSHDDAFEGRIEHTVLLTKSAAGGTAVESQ